MEIVLQGLTKEFKNTVAVRDLTVTIPDGGLVCLLGPSGCGKSTTLLMIAGLEPPTAGSILFDGRPVDHLEAEERDIGMVFQNYALYPHMTVLDNILFPLKMRRVPKARRREQAMEIARMMQLEELLGRKPSQLSGGQQQRVAIARALVKQPGILLLDEPFSNLDARLRIELRDEIRGLQQRLGITTIFVTHDQEEAMSISDQILLLERGVLQQYATPKEMYTRPANRFVAGFLGNPPINFFPCTLLSGGRAVLGETESQCIPLAHSRPEGERCQAGIRPEDLVVTLQELPLTGRVAAVQTLGKEQYLRLELCGQQATACLSWDHTYHPGDNIGLGVKRVHLFDQNGAALDSQGEVSR